MSNHAPAKPSHLSGYMPLLARKHCVHRGEMRRIVRQLPIERGASILDIACGDGAFLRWLSEKTGPNGMVVGVDASPAALAIAAKLSRKRSGWGNVTLLDARAEHLPFSQRTFDFVWCGQSLISLPHPAAVLEEIGRVLRRGGLVAVMEDDAMHDILLPWPPDLELAVHQAQFSASQAVHDASIYVGRRLEHLLIEGHFRPIRRTTYPVDRSTPLSRMERDYVEQYLSQLYHHLRDYLSPQMQRRFQAAFRPTTQHYLFNTESAFVTFLHFVVIGQKVTT